MRNVYLDYSATTPVKEEVLKEMIPYFTEKFGNPSSLYDKGLEAKEGNLFYSGRNRSGQLVAYGRSGQAQRQRKSYHNDED